MSRNRANLRRRQGYHSHRFTIERHEFDFVAGALVMDKDNGPNISGNETMFWNIFAKYDSLVFSDHLLPLAERIGGYQSRNRLAALDKPHGANHRLASIRRT